MRRAPLLGRTLAEWLAVTLLCIGMAAVTTADGWLWRLDRVLYDAAMASRSLPPDPDVVIVAIDDRSLAAIGRWPWDRAVHAALLRRLKEAGTAAVALDIILHEPDPELPGADAALASAITDHGRVVLPVTHAGHAAASDGEGLPAAPFAAAAAALGHIHMELDPDGIARSVYLWEGLHRPRHPQLALALLGQVAPERAAAYPVPTVADAPGWRRAGWLHIPFRGPPGSFRYVSYIDVLRGDVPPGALREAVVFVGASAVGMGDSVPTPTSGHARTMPGVEVNATIFSALRGGEAIRLVSPGWAGALSVLPVVLLMLVMLRSGPRVSLFAAFACSAAILLASGLALVFGRWWWPPAGAVLACMLAYPLWSWRRLEAAQHYLDTELEALDSNDDLLVPAPVAARPAPTADRFGDRIARVREAARRQRTLQRFITDTLESLPVGAVVLDLQGAVRMANRRAGELLGARTAAELGTALAALPLPIDLAGAGAEPRQAEAELPDGSVLLVSSAGLFDEFGTALGAVIGLADVSALRAAQRSREETLYFLSHDLRAPLASILSVSAASAEGTELARAGGYARSALALVDNLFRLVRAEGLDPEQFSELLLEPVLQDAAEEVWDLARAKGVRLLLATERGEAALVVGDGDLLCRAVINLLTNAIKYTPPGGEIELSLAAEPEGWAVAVRDTGPGIDEQLRSRLFRRFSRLPTSENRRVSGVGLGLLMVRTVAERHGGSVDVHSRPGAGSRFVLHLPQPGA